SAGAEADEVVNATAVAVPLPADVPPGAVIPIPITVRAADDHGAPLPVWSPQENWSYDLEWELTDGKDAAEPRYRQGIAVLASDPGPSFLGSSLPGELDAGRVIPTNIGLRNAGPETWKASTTKVGHHWYYFDGTEAVWAGETTSLPNDVA